MPKIRYVEKRFSPPVAAAIQQAEQIVLEYTQAGYRLTLRQLYYQFVARDLLPNTQQSYKNLGAWINDARLAGLIDWNAIEDRTRNLMALGHWSSPQEIISSAARGYRLDLWDGQPWRVEVWVEKEALAGVIERPAEAWDCAWFCCRGYVSQSEMWRASRRVLRNREGGQKTLILHLGDHDPSGIDMTRDIIDRLEIFGAPCKVLRIALNEDQIAKFKPPPNPAKVTDSRARGYIERFGRSSWELDALDPVTLGELIERHIKEYVDIDTYKERIAKQEKEREQLTEVADDWESE
jgi:hypothetical protein